MSDHIDELLSAYIDNELSLTEKEFVEHHLETCEECKQEFLQLTALQARFREAFHFIEIPEQIEERVLAQLPLKPASRSFGLLNGAALLIMAAIAISLSIASGPVFTVSLYVFQTVFSIGRSLINALPSILAAIPYMAAGVFAFILAIVGLAIVTLRFLVHSVGKTARVEEV